MVVSVLKLFPACVLFCFTFFLCVWIYPTARDENYFFFAWFFSPRKGCGKILKTMGVYILLALLILNEFAGVFQSPLALP